MDFSLILQPQTCAKCKICCVFKEESLIYVPKNVETKKQKNGMYICVYNNAKKGCQLGKNKPIECAAWPFSIAKQKNELLLVLEHSCPELNKKENAEKVEKFALETVYPVLMEYAKKNPHLLREHNKKNKIIKIIC